MRPTATRRTVHTRCTATTTRCSRRSRKGAAGRSSLHPLVKALRGTRDRRCVAVRRCINHLVSLSPQGGNKGNRGNIPGHGGVCYLVCSLCSLCSLSWGRRRGDVVALPGADQRGPLVALLRLRANADLLRPDVETLELAGQPVRGDPDAAAEVGPRRPSSMLRALTISAENRRSMCSGQVSWMSASSCSSIVESMSSASAIVESATAIVRARSGHVPPAASATLSKHSHMSAALSFRPFGDSGRAAPMASAWRADHAASRRARSRVAGARLALAEALHRLAGRTALQTDRDAAVGGGVIDQVDAAHRDGGEHRELLELHARARADVAVDGYPAAESVVEYRDDGVVGVGGVAAELTINLVDEQRGASGLDRSEQHRRGDERCRASGAARTARSPRAGGSCRSASSASGRGDAA